MTIQSIIYQSTMFTILWWTKQIDHIWGLLLLVTLTFSSRSHEPTLYPLCLPPSLSSAKHDAKRGSEMGSWAHAGLRTWHGHTLHTWDGHTEVDTARLANAIQRQGHDVLAPEYVAVATAAFHRRDLASERKQSTYYINNALLQQQTHRLR